MTRGTWEIHNARGRLVRTTNDRTLALRYVKRMAAIGSNFHMVFTRPRETDERSSLSTTTAKRAD